MAIPADNKKIHFRHAFREFAERLFDLEFGKLASTQQTEGLTRYYIKEIYNKLNTPISDDDFESCYVDKSGDLGADFIYRDDGIVLILQTKFMSPGKQVDQSEILRFQNVLDRLADKDFIKNSKNRQLKDAASDIDFENDKFVLKFIACAQIIGQADQQTKKDAKLPDFEDLAERVEFNFSSEEQLNAELRDALSLASGIPDTCELIATGKRGQERSGILELQEAPHRSIIMVCDANQLVNLYDTHKSKLFTLNIRNYLGNTATNKSIIATLKEEAAHFYYYNNGIGCLAESLEILGDKVKIKGIQIINGAQTLRSLHKASKDASSRESVKHAKVLVRITEAKNQYGAEGKFRDKMVRFNNTQNVIKISDFRSNDPVHSDLRAKFESYRHFGKEVVYLNKRIALDTSRNKAVIPLEDFAKVIYAFLRDPVSFSAKSPFLFDESENGGYPVIFGDGKQVFSVMPEHDFRLRSAIWWIAEQFGIRLKEEKKGISDAVEKAALERKWILLFVARLILERSYGTEGYQHDLARLYKGEWLFAKEVDGQWMEELYKQTKQTVLFKYKEAISKPGFVHRNWMRSENTVTELINFIRDAPFFTEIRRPIVKQK